MRRFVDVLLASALLVVSAASHAGAQSRSAAEPAIKAAILFNLAKFITWPADALPSGAPLALCVVRDDPLAAALEPIVRGQTVETHPIAVNASPSPGATCHMMYLAGSDAGAARRQAEALRNAPVVTVSDAIDFARDGGTMRLFVDAGKMRLRVNLDAARRARVQISAHLLRLAEVVRDDTHGTP